MRPFNKGKILVNGEYVSKSYQIQPLLALGISILACLLASSFNTSDLISPIPEAYAFVSYPSESPEQPGQVIEVIDVPKDNKEPKLSDIEAYIMEVFGEDGELAIAVGMSESHLIPDKTLIASAGKHSWSSETYKGECSIGLFMINLASDNCNGKKVHYDKIPGDTLEEKIEWLKVPKNNIDTAKKIYDGRGGNFSAWSGYTGGGYLKHLK